MDGFALGLWLGEGELGLLLESWLGLERRLLLSCEGVDGGELEVGGNEVGGIGGGVRCAVLQPPRRATTTNRQMVY